MKSDQRAKPASVTVSLTVDEVVALLQAASVAGEAPEGAAFGGPLDLALGKLGRALRGEE